MSLSSKSGELPIVFFIGAGRSGTTALSECIGQHSKITHWYEPYFIWDKYLGSGDTDVRKAEQATPEVIENIRREFGWYLDKSGSDYLIEKSPENCLRIPLLHAIFPEAKWIHLVRDGRDTILSINKEWHMRRKIVEERDLLQLFAVVQEALSLQPYWRNKFQLLWFEFSQHMRSGFRTVLNKSRWKGKVGYGTRFPGWEEALDEMNDLMFNAVQWKNSLEYSLHDLQSIPQDRIHNVRYEDVGNAPEEELKKIFDFLCVDNSEAASIAPTFYRSNSGKWKNAFSIEQRKGICEIINEMLITLGYVSDDSWVLDE